MSNTHAIDAAIGHVVFPFMFLCGVAWLICASAVFRKLRESHPDTYRAMGEPRLFSGNSRSGVALLQFIGRREYRGLNDAGLSRLGNFMLALAVVLMTTFIGLAALNITYALFPFGP